MAKYDGFDNWASVAGEFSGNYDWDEQRKAKSLAEIPEPDEVLVAAYNQESYEGDAWVVYRNGDKYYQVEGGHCSCYGLENQWNPEEYDSAESLLESLNRGHSYGAKGIHLSLVKHILETRISNKEKRKS